MKKFTKHILQLFIFITILGACDVVPEDEVVKDPTTNPTEPTEPTEPIEGEIVKKVLLEEFTGHTCGNCPRGAETAEQLHDLYGDRLVTIAVHAGYFALPRDNQSGKYNSDFRTEVGNEVDEVFGVSASGLPKGMINRADFNSSEYVSYTAWQAAIEAALEKAPEMGIFIEGNYNTSTRDLSTTINVKSLIDSEGTYRLVVYYTENNIMDWQKDYDASPSDIENYTHKHALKGTVNSIWGDMVSNTALAVDDEFSFNYSMNLPENINHENCEIIAFIYNDATREVIQVEKTNLVEL